MSSLKSLAKMVVPLYAALAIGCAAPQQQAPTACEEGLEYLRGIGGSIVDLERSYSVLAKKIAEGDIPVCEGYRFENEVSKNYSLMTAGLFLEILARAQTKETNDKIILNSRPVIESACSRLDSNTDGLITEEEARSGLAFFLNSLLMNPYQNHSKESEKPSGESL